MPEFLNRKDLLRKTEIHIKKLLRDESSGHDWWHIHRVRNTALKLARDEGADLFITELGALLHDIADHKFHDGDENAGPLAAESFLRSINADPKIISEVCTIIREVSFKGAGVETPVSSKEAAVVQDADRLDAMGAVGIARTFAYGGYSGQPMYDPELNPQLHEDFDSYKSNRSSTINHFYEKLLLLKDRMNTEAGRRMAKDRHLYMQNYLKRFMEEWKGEK